MSKTNITPKGKPKHKFKIELSRKANTFRPICYSMMMHHHFMALYEKYPSINYVEQ